MATPDPLTPLHNVTTNLPIVPFPTSAAELEQLTGAQVKDITGQLRVGSSHLPVQGGSKGRPWLLFDLVMGRGGWEGL